MASAVNMQDTTGWICEYAKNPKHCFDAVADALPRFSLDLIRIIVPYLRKSDMYGREELEEAYGRERLRRELDGDMVVPELHDSIDWILQQDLEPGVFFKSFGARNHFMYESNARVLWQTVVDVAGFFTGCKTSQKVTEVFSLYLKPEHLRGVQAARIMAERWGKDGAGSVIEGGDQELSSIPGANYGYGYWLLFANHSLGKGRRYELLQTILPEPFCAPQADDGLFCIFTKYACTGERIYKDGEFTICADVRSDYVGAPESRIRHVILGDFRNKTVKIQYASDTYDYNHCQRVCGVGLALRLLFRKDAVPFGASSES